MRYRLRSMLALALAAGCATSTRQNALVAAISAKEVVTAVYEPWDEYVLDRVADCHESVPPTTHTKSEFDACLGPAAKHETVIEPALAAYHTAALGLYVTLMADATNDEIDAARLELARAVAVLLQKVPSVNAAITHVKKNIGGR